MVLAKLTIRDSSKSNGFVHINLPTRGLIPSLRNVPGLSKLRNRRAHQNAIVYKALRQSVIRNTPGAR